MHLISNRVISKNYSSYKFNRELLFKAVEQQKRKNVLAKKIEIELAQKEHVIRQTREV